MHTFALYEDPLHGEHLVISGYEIGLNMVPDKMKISDPILLRHILCLLIVAHNCFHLILCRRQLKLCKRSNDPPSLMDDSMSPEAFEVSKDKQLHTSYLEVFNLILDTIYSCLDLYLSTLAYFWKITVGWYRYADDIWLNVTYMTMFSTYLVIRMLPSLFYEKLVLDPKFNVDPEKSPPLVGMICALAFVVVFLQIAIIPFTAIFMAIQELNVWYCILLVWLILVGLSLFILGFVGIFGVPCLGKSRKLEDADINDDLKEVLHSFKFPGRVYLVHTFQIGRPTAWVMGCFCCLRLDIHDNLKLNRGLDSDDLDSGEVGAGLKDEQLAAFVAHQLAHWHLRHVAKALALIYLNLFIYLVLFGLCYNWQTLYWAAGFTPLYPKTVGFWLVYKYLMPVFRDISTWMVFFFIRHFEYAADAYVVRRGFGSAMKAALLKLFTDDNEFPYVDHWYLMWHRLRPSILQRIQHLQRLNRTHAVSAISLI
ncbi:CAAX prenyl protease 1 homolog [Drosophila takahashii]|uniref:CAAX prenyl protease 1 homolog n=1 Tax=Drosophila takahashii TaxID=29030 RepID=UPI001CF89C50|nr:CAAX prenyl protease 1 homolog [Drosophila takahashii]